MLGRQWLVLSILRCTRHVALEAGTENDEERERTGNLCFGQKTANTKASCRRHLSLRLRLKSSSRRAIGEYE